MRRAAAQAAAGPVGDYPMSEFEKATPRPWTLRRTVISAFIEVKDGPAITSIPIGYEYWHAPELWETSTEAHNARLIIAAVNERDALREALTIAATAIEETIRRLDEYEAGFRPVHYAHFELDWTLNRIRKLLEGGNG